MKFNLSGYQSQKAPETTEFTNYVFPENSVVHFEVTKVRETDWGISLQIKGQGMVQGEKKTGFFFANVNPTSIQRVGALCESVGITPTGEIDSDDFEGKKGFCITKVYTKKDGEKANDIKFFLAPDDTRAAALKNALGLDSSKEILFDDDDFETPALTENPPTFSDGLDDDDFELIF